LLNSQHDFVRSVQLPVHYAAHAHFRVHTSDKSAVSLPFFSPIADPKRTGLVKA